MKKEPSGKFDGTADDRIDGLTGVLRKKAFFEEFEALLENLKDSEEPLSVVFIDLDNFKAFNDREGHLMGDELIRRFSGILAKNCRESDLLGRYGGEEFLLVMRDTLPEEALLMMEDIRRQVSSTTHVLNLPDRRIECKFTFSGGIAAAPRDGKDSRELVRAADGALYRAKTNGRDRLALAVKTRMVLKSNYYPKAQLDKLAKLAASSEKTEAFLLREALDDLLVKYQDRGGE